MSPSLLARLEQWMGDAGPLAQTVDNAARKLDGPTRAVALAALAGLVILGFALVLLTWLAGRYVRRLSRRDRSRSGPVREDDWVRSPGRNPRDDA